MGEEAAMRPSWARLEASASMLLPFLTTPIMCRMRGGEGGRGTCPSHLPNTKPLSGLLSCSGMDLDSHDR